MAQQAAAAGSEEQAVAVAAAVVPATGGAVASTGMSKQQMTQLNSQLEGIESLIRQLVEKA